MRIFDFHVHPGYDFHNDELGYEITPEIFVEGLKKSGVTHCAGSAIHKWVGNKPLDEQGEVMKTLNAEAYEFYKMYPDFYSTGIHIHPNFAEESCAEIEKYAAKGVKLIGELVPNLTKWSSYMQDGMYDILKVAEKHDMVLSLHLMSIDSIFEMAKTFPNLRIVVAHIDAYGLYDRQIELMMKYENVYSDISAHGHDRAGMLRQTLDAVGKDRILMGSDYPGYNASTFINVVLENSIKDAEREAILWDNAAKLLCVK